MRILIVGADGQLGRCLKLALEIHELAPLGHSALDITRFDDVRDALAGHRPDVVINASAFNDVDGAESRVIEAYAVNSAGPRNLAVATASRGIPLVHVSTDYVFDGAAHRPYHELDLANPLSLYGASKLAGEDAVRSFNPRHYIVRTAWLFWEYGRNFLLSMYGNASQPRLCVANDQYGSPTYVPHLAACIGRLIATGKYGTYHMAGRGGASRWEVVSLLFQLLRVTTPVLPVSRLSFPAAAERPSYSVLTTIQNMPIELPAWQDGLVEFAQGLAGTSLT